MLRSSPAVLGGLCLALCATASGLSNPLPEITYLAPAQGTNDLLDQGNLSARLVALAASHPDLAQTFTLGNSRGGAAIEGVRLSAGEDSIGKPAILVVAGIQAQRVFSTTMAMAAAEEAAATYGLTDAKHLLDFATVYVIPRLNPDGAATRFESVLMDGGATGHDVDNDRDGQKGEDGPVDVNGDGKISWMRVADPEGTWIEDPFDARAHVEADANHGERGMWKIMREGLDQDGDDQIAEDSAADGHVSRNFPAGFEEHTAGAGFFAGDDPEVRAMMEFVVEHPEIALVVTFDGTDNLASKPETEDDPTGGRGFGGARNLPNGKVLQSDANLIAEFGRRAKDLRKDSPAVDAYPKGSFQRWMYEARGILTLDMAPWAMPTEAPKPDAEDSDSGAADIKADDEADESAKDEGDADTWREASEDVGRLAWMDATDNADRFIAWQPYNHPTLGGVFIGGWAPFAHTEPPTAEREAIATAATAFLLGLGEPLAKVEITSFTATKLSRSLWRVEAAVENNSLLPLITKAGERARTTRPARMELSLPDKATIIAGEGKQLIRQLDGSGGRAEFTWLIDMNNPAQLGLNISTDHAGSASMTCTEEDK
ncbi:MAG: hypothetical protein ACI9C2_001550 [Gammaproteobacteria bacterium]|jgi:hypothetical protein